MKNTVVVNVKVKYIRDSSSKNNDKVYNNLKDWISNPKNVYIGRGYVIFVQKDDGTGKERFPKGNSLFYNPYIIPKELNGKDREEARKDVIKKYRKYMEKKLNKDPALVKELLKLKGKRLGCWCVDDKIDESGCHGGVLKKLIKKYDSK